MAKITGEKQSNDLAGYIPEGLYRARCINSKATDKNKSGWPMITLDCEIIEPETFQQDGAEKICAGRKFQLFLIYNPTKDGWASQAQAIGFMENLGITVTNDAGELNVDTDLHRDYFVGMEFDIPLSAAEDFKKYMAGPNAGKPILDGEGKKISSGYRIQANASDVGPNCRPKKNEEVAAAPY